MAKVSDMLSSKYIKKDDVGTAGRVFTIRSCSRENVAKQNEAPEHKWVLRFDGTEKGMVLNNKNIKSLQEHYGDDSDAWVNKRVMLYNDPSVEMGGKTVGGIRLKFPKKTGEPAAVAAAPAKPAAPAPELAIVDDGFERPAEPSFDDEVPF